MDWKTPPPGQLKFNFDAVIRHNKVTVAACCRTDTGELIYACSKNLPAGDPLWGEAHATLLAITSAQDIECKYVLFEGDALGIVEAFSKNSEDIDWSICGIINDAKSLLHSFKAWDFVHVHGEAIFLCT